MLMGPWALTTAGAATVETAPAAATFKKRRRVEVLSLVGLVMASSPDERPLVNRPLFFDLLAVSLGLRRGLASLVVVVRRYDAPPDAGSDPMVPLLWISRQSGSQGPNLHPFVCDAGLEQQAMVAQSSVHVLLPAAVATGSTSLAARSGVSSFQRTDPNGRSSMRRTRTGSGPR